MISGCYFFGVPSENDHPKKVSAPIRMSPELLEKVTEASKRTGLAQADILRLALAIGLEDLKKIDYNIAGSISDAANPRPIRYPNAEEDKQEVLRVAEDPKEYGKSSRSGLA
jgi:predicted DNA-binding protein